MLALPQGFSFIFAFDYRCHDIIRRILFSEKGHLENCIVARFLDLVDIQACGLMDFRFIIYNGFTFSEFRDKMKMFLQHRAIFISHMVINKQS